MSVDPHTIGTAFVTGGSGYVGRNLLRTLTDQGVAVRALARSDASAAVVSDLGAQPIRGDLLDAHALIRGMSGADTVFHSAAFVDDWCRDDRADRLNIDGTRRVLTAAARTEVGSLVHVSTEGVLLGGPPLDRADETWPYPRKPLGPYPRTKGAAERLVKQAASRGLRACIVRPRFIWGNDDSTLLPRLVQATEQKLLRWMDGGEYLTSTCHVDNCVEGMLRAAERGRPGEAYFLTDGEPVVFRQFVSDLLRTRDVEPPSGTIPSWGMVAAGVACEILWAIPLVPGQPPVTRFAVRVIGPCTVVDRKAREELGYRAETSIQAGLRDLESRAAATGSAH